MSASSRAKGEAPGAPPDGPRMGTVRANSLVAQVYQRVRAEIGRGEHGEGKPVNIAETAKRLDVSATPVREAFARLAAEGLLRFHDNMGYRVPEALTAKDYIDWAVARVIVESGALEHLSGPLDARVLDEATAINEELSRAAFGIGEDGIERYSELNWRFHTKLIALARNAVLSELHARLYAAPQFARVFVGRGVLHQSHVVEEHRAILAALRQGDGAAAAAAMRRHIVDSLERDAQTGEVCPLPEAPGARALTPSKPGHFILERTMRAVALLRPPAWRFGSSP